MARNKPGKTKKRSRAKESLKRRSVTSARQKVPALDAKWFPWILLAVVTLFAYINAAPDVMVFDDKEFVSGGRFENLAPSDFVAFFSQSLWEASGSRTNLYRPLLLVSFGVEAVLFGDWLAGYHLVNVLLHVVAVLLVFGFARQVFWSMGYDRACSQWATLMASLVFAVHPVFTDVVDSVFNGSEIYVVIGVVGGLWYLLLHRQQNPARAWLVLGILFLWALLYRESAVSLPALAVLTLWMTSDQGWKQRVKRCLPVLLLLIPLAVYMAMRVHALEAPDRWAGDTEKDFTVQVVEDSPGVSQATTPTGTLAISDSSSQDTEPENLLDRFGLNFKKERIGNAVSTWFDGLKLMVWPRPLILLREPTKTPVLLALVTQAALLTLALFLLYRRRPALFTGLVFFYLAILPSSRILSEGFLPPSLMDRMLYLPSVGLVVALSAGLAWLAGKTSKKTAVVMSALVIMVFIPLTWARNEVRSHELHLLETDFAVTSKNTQLLYSLIKVNTKAGKLERSIDLCKKFPGTTRSIVAINRECANTLVSAGRFEQAELEFKRILEKRPLNARTHFDLARMYAQQKRRAEARGHYKIAIKREMLPYLREFMTAMMLMELYPYDRQRLLQAREHLEFALELQPRSEPVQEAMRVVNQKL